VKPIALKEARNRWYLIAQDRKDDEIKNFSLDRIGNLTITVENFKPVTYNAHMEFNDSFGIINGTGEKAQKIVLSFTPEQGRYIKSLPLHHSQKLLLETEDEIQFKYFIRPTYDFTMEILSYGDRVKVMAPESLQKKIKKQLEKSLMKY
jgi:predicted DNA-binding transcriptional regulator YafY